MYIVPLQKSLLSKSFLGLQPLGFRLSQAETLFFSSQSNRLQYNNLYITNLKLKLIKLTKIRSGDKGSITRLACWYVCKGVKKDQTFNLNASNYMNVAICVFIYKILIWHYVKLINMLHVYLYLATNTVYISLFIVIQQQTWETAWYNY